MTIRRLPIVPSSYVHILMATPVSSCGAKELVATTDQIILAIETLCVESMLKIVSKSDCLVYRARMGFWIFLRLSPGS